MMLADDPSQFAKLFVLEKSGPICHTISPVFLLMIARIFVFLASKIRLSGWNLISRIVPFVLSENRYAVNVHPVTTSLSVKSRITEQNIFAASSNSIFSNDQKHASSTEYSLPVYFDDLVIDQFFIGNLMIVYIFMGQNDGISTVGFRFAARIIISDGISFSLVIVMPVLPARSVLFPDLRSVPGSNFQTIFPS